MIKVSYMNDVEMYVEASNGIDHELMEFFSFYVDGYRFMPRYKNKQWDGKINLYTPYQKRMYLGLLSQVIEYAQLMDYKIEIEPEVINCFYNKHFTDQVIEDFIDSIDVRSKGEQIFPYDHQRKAIVNGIKLNRMTLISGTSSGKSLIAYFLCRWFMEGSDEMYREMSDSGKILVITDSVMLVDQFVDDFIDYSTHNGWDAEGSCHKIYSGQDKETKKPIVITTWQSAMKQPRKWFDQFNYCINDEVHKAKADALKGIHHKMVECPVKIGMTGTLDNAECNKLVIVGLFGPIQQFTTTKELMDKGMVANLKIEGIQLKYPEEDCKLVRRAKYQDEIKFITKKKKRTQMIAHLAKVQGKRNTLILANNVKHCVDMYDEICETLDDPTREVFIITGSVAREVRNEIKKLAEMADGAVIVATYG